MDIKFSAELAFRLLLAGVLGSFIGLNREMHAKEAGIRTHFLVSFGSALFMITSKYAFMDLGAMGNLIADPSRIASGVVSGIGFLGAGTIIMRQRSVQGLTTAAGLWATSAIGLAAGGGMYTLSVIAAIIIWLCFEFLGLFYKFIPTKTRKIKAEFLFDQNFSFDALFELLNKYKIKLLESNIGIVKNENSSIIKSDFVIKAPKRFDVMNLTQDISKIYQVKKFDLQ